MSIRLMVSSGRPSPEHCLSDTQAYDDRDEVPNLKGPKRNKNVNTRAEGECRAGTDITANIRAYVMVAWNM